MNKKNMVFATMTTFGMLTFAMVAAQYILPHSLIPRVQAENPTSLYKSFDFSDGGSSTNSAYANTNLATNISYAADNPGGAGTTAWEADYANLSLTTGTRLGGKLASTAQTDDTTAWCNIKTKFSIDKTIDAVKIYDVFAFGTRANLGNIYLQKSSDGTTWTTVYTYTDSQTLPTATPGSTLLFDNLGIAADYYLRLGCALTASTTNSGMSFNKMTVHSYSQC